MQFFWGLGSVTTARTSDLLGANLQGVALTTLSRRKPVSDALQSERLEQANTHVQASAESLRLLLGIFTNRL